MRNIKVGYKAEPQWTDKELKSLKRYQEAFSPNAIRFKAANVVRIGTSLFLADIM